MQTFSQEGKLSLSITLDSIPLPYRTVLRSWVLILSDVSIQMERYMSSWIIALLPGTRRGLGILS